MTQTHRRPYTDYRSPWWLPGGHLQTIITARFTPKPTVEYRRERWDTPDGDFLDIDFTVHPADANAPYLVMFHGLEGDSQSHYCVSLMQACQAHGWHGAVVHFRGCSGEFNRLPRAYHSGDSREIEWIFQQFAQRYPTKRRYAVGVSLGGNMMLKWLGEEGQRAKALVDAAISVSAPVDLEAGAYALSSGFNMIYTRMFLDSLIPKTLEKAQRFPGLLDTEAIKASKNFFEFDELVTAKLHGFASAHDYWRKSASKPLLKFIEVPTLIINAKNDPFMPGRFLPHVHEVSNQVSLDFPDHGGHVGFPSKARWPAGLEWLPQRCFGFFQAYQHG